MSVVAVLDVGKTNVKLHAVGADGAPLEARGIPNPVRDGPPWRHHDLAAIEAWLLAALRDLGRRHAIAAIVPAGHGGSGVLVGPDGPVVPMIDYEAAPPAGIDAAYRAAADPFAERGSAIMLGAAHAARQLVWLGRDAPEALARATAWLHVPQYWAWRLSGVLADEVTSAAAETHLWCVPEARPARIVGRMGWGRLMPPMRPAWEPLGTLRPEIAAATGLDPATRVLNGIHDSSANVYRYEAAGLADLAVVSTGTWIVALTDRTRGLDLAAERPGGTLNADVSGRPVPGMLAMAGREFAAIAGRAPGPASRAALARIVAAGTMALPFFGRDDGLFPGRAGQGRLAGPPGDPATLALLTAALLTAEMLARLPATATVVLDGSFVRDPLYGALVQALHPSARVLVNPARDGLAAGAALLARHGGTTPPVALIAPDLAGIPDLAPYAALWHERLSLETQP